MKIHRFYIQEPITAHQMFRSKDENLVHQLRDVFRMKKGQNVVLFDGTGYEFNAKLELLTRKEVEFAVGEGAEKTEKGSDIHLFLSIIKKDKFELAIEKATELGVSKITPVVAERSQYKNIRPDRLQRVIVEAAEQCGRVTIPEITPEISIEEALEQNKDIVVLDMNGNTTINSSIYKVLVGPEGGWSEKEQGMFNEKNVCIASLPFNTLRTETAVIVGLARSL